MNIPDELREKLAIETGYTEGINQVLSEIKKAFSNLGNKITETATAFESFRNSYKKPELKETKKPYFRQNERW